MKVLSMERILLQYFVLNYKIYVYFPEHKLAIEIDEKGHTDRKIDYEIERKNKVKEKLGCIFIRINPGEKDYDIFVEISKIHNHIKQSV